jgi:hypothetical protein
VWSVKYTHCGGLENNEGADVEEEEEDRSWRCFFLHECELPLCARAKNCTGCKWMAACRSRSTLVFCTSARGLHTCKELHRVKKKNGGLPRSSSTLVFCTSANPFCTRAKNCTGCKKNGGLVADRVQRYSNLDTVTHFRCQTHALVQRLGNTIYAVCDMKSTHKCEGWGNKLTQCRGWRIESTRAWFHFFIFASILRK